MGESNWWNGQIGSDTVKADISTHCWAPINSHQFMFFQGWVPNISNQQLGNQQLVSSWYDWLLGTQLLGCAAFYPTLDQIFQIL